MTRMTGADAIIRSLETEGVEVCFGIPGGAILPTYDALFAAYKRGSPLRHVLARHEQGAGHMAEGYARASGRPGVAIATSGPGATNLVTPIADAWMDSTPIVCITGQVVSSLIGTDAFQETDPTGITMPIVKHSWLVQDAEEIPQVIKSAFHVATTGRPGPVLVDITKDAQQAEMEFRYPDAVDLPGWNPPTTVDLRQVGEAARAILAAEKPILYVGGGVVNGGASAELLELAELTGIPVVTTLMGKGGFPDSHPLAFGHPGMHGGKWANWALNKSDLVIAVGSRFDDRVTGKLSAFAPGAKVVHFDIDAAEISKIRTAEIPVVGPLRLALAELGKVVRAEIGPEHQPPTEWVEQIVAWREQFPLRYERGEQMKPQTVLETLRDLTSGRDDVVWTTGVGQHQMWAMQYLVCDRPRSFITSGGLGTMGYGIPAAIGAKAARPDATVICVDGDGCFQMTQQELTTATLEKLPVLIVVIDNGWLGMVRQWQEMFYDERYVETHLTRTVPDFALVAEAHGGIGLSVQSEDELASTLAEALERVQEGRTVVVDAHVDQEEKCFPMIPTGAAATDVIEYGDRKAEEVQTL
jgi:acetolactate synthase-1/2/3 large subunit